MLKNVFGVGGSSWRSNLHAPGGDFEVILGASGAPFWENVRSFLDIIF